MKKKVQILSLLYEMIGNYAGAVQGFASQVDKDAEKRADEMIASFNVKAKRLIDLIEES